MAMEDLQISGMTEQKCPEVKCTNEDCSQKMSLTLIQCDSCLSKQSKEILENLVKELYTNGTFLI